MKSRTVENRGWGHIGLKTTAEEGMGRTFNAAKHFHNISITLLRDLPRRLQSADARGCYASEAIPTSSPRRQGTEQHLDASGRTCPSAERTGHIHQQERQGPQVGWTRCLRQTMRGGSGNQIPLPSQSLPSSATGLMCAP